jgi:ribulose bisphosphate carboxylase small subunit
MKIMMKNKMMIGTIVSLVILALGFYVKKTQSQVNETIDIVQSEQVVTDKQPQYNIDKELECLSFLEERGFQIFERNNKMNFPKQKRYFRRNKQTQERIQYLADKGFYVIHYTDMSKFRQEFFWKKLAELE